ncbi:MAG: hypothetical protein EPGJADBJ_00648 [Saprospiraceae bacterium]|nr:hypothetical protein [Saprospiraceae bacterium]
MRHITNFFILIIVFFANSVSAQQWESFLSPPWPMANSKLLTIEDKVFIFAGNGLYRSSDGGDHWEQIRAYQSDNVAQVLEVNRNNNRLYWSEGLDSMSFYQLFSSADLGDTWQPAGNVKASVSAFIGDTVYGGCYDGSGLCSKLGSASWKTIPYYPKDSAGYILGLTAEGANLWAATENGIYHSPDAGYNWEHSLPMDDVQVTYHSNGMPTFLIKALNGEVIVTDEIKKLLYFTKDNGATWQEAPWEGIGLYNSGQHLYATDATGKQLWRFEGGGPSNWTVLSVGAVSNLKLTGVGEHDGGIWLGSEWLGIIRKKPDSDKWQLANGEPNTGGGNLRYQDGHLFLNTTPQTFSADNGATWQQNLHAIFPGLWSNGNYDYTFTGAILRCPRNGRFEWETYSTPPEPASGVMALGDTLLAVKQSPASKIFQSFDNGASWSNTVTIPTALQGAGIRVLQGKLYVIKDKTLHRSDDLGATWQPVYTFPYKVDETVGRFFIVKDTILLSHPPLDLTFYSADGGQSFDTLPAPQNFNTNAYRLRARKDILLLHLDENVFYVSKDVGKTWTSLLPPPGADLVSITSGDSWTYGDNALYFPGNWRLRLDDQRQASGKVFLDSNGNGQKDIGEPGLNNFVVKAAQSGALGATYNDGDFSMFFGQQADELSVANVPPHYAAAPASVAVTAGAGSIPPPSFAIQPQGTVNDAGVNLVAAKAFRAGYDNTLYVNVKNAGTVASNGQLKLALSPLLSVISTTPAADAIIGDTLIWDFANLQPLKERKFQVDVKTAVVPPGEPVFVKAETFNGADVDMTNNTAVLDEQVVSSYDPNDKAVSETHVPVNEADEEELVYTVRFQNLGNVETDFITVRDTLSAALDAASVRVLTASHPWELHIEDGRVLVFRFNPIRLAPASEDSLGSQGFVQFAIRMKPGLEVGNEIANTAHIYFDFNPAVVTNTVVTSIAVVATFEPSQRALPLEVFPNPAGSRVTLRLPEGFEGEGRIEIFSVKGRLVYSAAALGSSQEIDLSGVPTGVYWCRWTAGGKVFWGKAAVQR